MRSMLILGAIRKRALMLHVQSLPMKPLIQKMTHHCLFYPIFQSRRGGGGGGGRSVAVLLWLHVRCVFKNSGLWCAIPVRFESFLFVFKSQNRTNKFGFLSAIEPSNIMSFFYEIMSNKDFFGTIEK